MRDRTPEGVGRARGGLGRGGLTGVVALAGLLAAQPLSATTLYFDGGYHKGRASGAGAAGGNGAGSGGGGADSTTLDPRDLVETLHGTDTHGCMAATVGKPVDFRIDDGSAPGTHFAFSSGSYGDPESPIPGLAMSDDGAVTGTATEGSAGTFRYVYYDDKGTGGYGLQCYQVAGGGSPSPSFDRMYGWYVEVGDYVDLPAPHLTGNAGRVAWTLSPALPPGMIFNSGEIYGAVTAEAVWTGTITATDAAGGAATTNPFTLTFGVTKPLPTLTTSGTCIATARQDEVNWNGWVWTDRPSDAVTWSGIMPDGLSLDPSDGTISGKPDQTDRNKNMTGVYVTATWSNDLGYHSLGYEVCANQDKQVVGLSVDPLKAVSAPTGQKVSVPAPTTHGGSGGVTWSVSPNPPGGFTFSNGAVSGKSAYPVEYSYTVTGTDADGSAASTDGAITVYDATPSLRYDGTCIGAANAPAQSGQSLTYFPWIIHNPLQAPMQWEMTDYSNDLATGNFGVDERRWLTLDAATGFVSLTVPTAGARSDPTAPGGLSLVQEGDYSGTITMRTTVTDAVGQHVFENPFCFHFKVGNPYSGSGGGIRG